MKLNVIIVDDEPLAINVLKNYAAQVKELHLEETFSNAVDAATYLQTNKVDLIFLDINMPILDGLEFIKTLQDPPLIIITTAHEEFAVESFELEVMDYLVKPISFPRFLKAVNRIFKSRQIQSDTNKQDDHPSIFVKVDKKEIAKNLSR